MSEKPVSVKIIAGVTLIATLLVTLIFGVAEVLLLFQFGISIFGAAYILVTLILQGYAFIISIAMLVSDSKYVWYASVAFWISVIVADLPFFYIVLIAQLLPILGAVLFSPMLSSIMCLYFFLRGKVKDHFHVRVK